MPDTPVTRKEVTATLVWLDRSIGGNPQFVDYRRLARAYLTLLDERDALQEQVTELRGASQGGRD